MCRKTNQPYLNQNICLHLHKHFSFNKTKKKKAAAKFHFMTYGQIMLKALLSTTRSSKLSNNEPTQYLDG